MYDINICLIYHTPFATILIEGDISSMNSRILDLLEKVGLKERALYKNLENQYHLI